MTLRLGDGVVVADLHSGSGGSIGDLIEGDMRPGLQSWRNVGNGILSVVQVVAAERVASNDRSDDVGTGLRPRTAQRSSRKADQTGAAEAFADQNSKRRFS